MGILVVGAGSTGGYFGGRLAQAGRDVTFLVRPQRAERLCADGLRIVSPHGDVTLTPKLVTAGHIEAPYDDKMRPGSTWMSFAFSRISDNQFHDRYKMNDSGIEGAETYTITPKRLTIEGAAMIKGKSEPYVEVWDRVD